MEQLHQRSGSQGLVIMALNYQEGFKQVKAFVEQHRLSSTAFRDEDGAVLRKYSVIGLPTTYLIGRDSSLLARGVGGRDWTKAQGRELIRALLDEGPRLPVPPPSREGKK